MFIHMYIVYTHPLFVASHSSWWNDQGLQDKTHVTWPCCVYIYMGISENWIKGWFALLPWPWWPIEIFPEVTVRYCKWPSENYDSSNKTLIYIYIYSKYIYIFIIGWWSHTISIIWVSRSSLYIIVIHEYVTCVSPCSF